MATNLLEKLNKKYEIRKKRGGRYEIITSKRKLVYCPNTDFLKIDSLTNTNQAGRWIKNNLIDS